MYNKKNAIKVIEILKQYYPDAECSLNFNTPFELLVATILSAQCTDERVNKTTPNLFKKYSTPEDIDNMDINELENIIRPCGFYKNKAKNIKACANKIVNQFNGIVPKTMDELITLPGVGRKTANVVMLNAFNSPQGIAVDTHAKRISNLIGLSNEKDPLKIELDLEDINHLFVWHGRNICIARKPKCENCPIKKYCNNYINSKH